jgi:hypothetical protein
LFPDELSVFCLEVGVVTCQIVQNVNHVGQIWEGYLERITELKQEKE